MPHSAKTIDYYFSVLSPWTYLGDKRLREMAERYGFKIRHHPLLSPVLFPATGGLPLKDRAEQRKAYRMEELVRWHEHLGIDINLTPKFFPVAEAPASKLILTALDVREDVGELVHAIGRAVWKEERDINDPATLTDIADECGMDGATLVKTSEDEIYDRALNDETQAAIKNGVFGYPTYVLGNDMFWGQDRLDFLERALQKG